MLTLYYSEKSCSFAPHILLYDTGANFVAKRIDFDTGEQNSQGYLSVNPKGRVPALMTPDGVLTENPAILLYIAQMYPEKQLAPKEPFEEKVYLRYGQTDEVRNMGNYYVEAPYGRSLKLNISNISDIEAIVFSNNGYGTITTMPKEKYGTNSWTTGGNPKPMKKKVEL